MRSTLRVAMLIQAYHPRVGGTERQIGALAGLLAQQGVDIHILTRRYPGLKPFERINGIPVHRLPIPGPKPMAVLTFMAAALARLRQLAPDVVHAHGLLSPATTAVAAKRLLGIPAIVTVNDRTVEGELARVRRRMFSKPRLAALREDIDAFAVSSREVDRELADLGIPRGRRPFIPNGVDTAHFAPPAPERKIALRSDLNLPDAPIAMYAGRLMPGKQIKRLIGIWDSVRAVHPDARLLIAGSGSEEAALKEAAGAGVQFRGAVDNIVPLLQASDVFVLPSAGEGVPVALLEAMSTGLAPVAIAAGGNMDAIDSIRNGWLVPPNDPSTWRFAIVSLFNDPAWRAQLGQEARETVLTNYPLRDRARRLCSLYERVVAGHHEPAPAIA